MELLGRQQREPGGQIEPHLVAEDGQRPGPRPVLLADPVVEDVLEQIEILAHGDRWGESNFSAGGDQDGCGVPRPTNAMVL